MSFQPFQDTPNFTPKTASIWHNNGNNKNPRQPYMNISLQLARPHNPDIAVTAQFKYDGKKRRLELDVTVPSEW